MRTPRKTRATHRAAMIGIAIFFMGGLWSKPSFGWGKTWMGADLERIVNAARWKIGLLRFNAAFQIGNAGYDSNIYYGDTPNPVPDYTFTAGPDLHFFIPLKNGIVFDLSEIPNYVFFLDSKKERSLNNSFRGQVHFALDKLYFQAGVGLRDARERATMETNLNIRHKENSLAALLFWQIAKGTAIAFQTRFIIYQYGDAGDTSSDIWKNLDRKESYFKLTAYLAQISRTRFYLDAEYGSFAPPEAISSFKNSRSFGLYGGLDFLPTRADIAQDRGIRGKINLGFKQFGVSDSPRKDYQGLVGKADFSVNTIKFLTFRGLFSRDIQFSVYSELSYYIQTVYGAGFTRTLNRRIFFSYDFSLSRNTYGQGLEGTLVPIKPDEYINHNFGLNFLLGQDFGLNLIVNLGKRSSNPVGLVNHRSFIGFSLVYGFSSGGVSTRSSPFSR